MVMMRHPLSGTEYHRNEDGTVRINGRGIEGHFTRTGKWMSGERKTADPGLCRWVSDGRPNVVDHSPPRTTDVGDSNPAG